MRKKTQKPTKKKKTKTDLAIRLQSGKSNSDSLKVTKKYFFVA